MSMHIIIFLIDTLTLDVVIYLACGELKYDTKLTFTLWYYNFGQGSTEVNLDYMYLISYLRNFRSFREGGGGSRFWVQTSELSSTLHVFGLTRSTSLNYESG